MNFSRSWWFEPKVHFWTSIFLYVLRVVVKVGVGLAIAAPVFVADGIHNTGDLGVLLAAYMVIWFVAKKSKGVYGADNLPAIFQGVVAILMGVLALWVAKESIAGLLNQPERMFDASSLGVITLATLISVVISLGTGAYQIRSGEPTLVAAGQEMKGDALIECSILAGFVGEYLFSMAWIEYVAGLCIVFKIAQISWKMGVETWNTLLQVSIGEKFEEGIRSLVSSTYGIGKITKFETYPLLGVAVRVKVWVLTQGGAEANEDIGEALRERIREYTLKEGHAKCKPDVFFAQPDKDWHRVAYALVDNAGVCFVAPRLKDANVLRVCAVEHGEIVSGEDIPAPRGTDQLLALIRSKRIRIYRAWDEENAVVGALRISGVTYKRTPTILPPEG
ncbi:MAG: hypothetical protein A3D65_05225 [Candidatus Lloydbacteria bacterium RIFCSPHIGHO2_02_FULL_50_13]|uniref:Cation efflux protein transmembrane domain-containing protein n=1 Tax=Candidatus Lloydbacteria bacterium RIFCSPHIGHO2_02_FULL_50_13 TaxID=1798661 RepID=A0A1G2D0L4_9BACT|nr:MAG: hypothetical protein A3D65_05225 [Candidatus Lloydbacteria bacterium RIFCSPHIGHO2_02_FULL_50_13]